MRRLFSIAVLLATLLSGLASASEFLQPGERARNGAGAFGRAMLLKGGPILGPIAQPGVQLYYHLGNVGSPSGPLRPLEVIHDAVLDQAGSQVSAFTFSEHGNILVKADVATSGYPIRGLVLAPTILNDAIRTEMGSIAGMEYAPAYVAAGFAATVGGSFGPAAVWSTPFFGTSLNTSTLLVNNFYDVLSTPQINPGSGTATLTNRYGHYFANRGGTGTQNKVVGFYCEDQTIAGASPTVACITSKISTGAGRLGLQLDGNADNLFGTGTNYGGASTSSDLLLSANAGFSASWLQANTGRIKFRERVTFPDSWSPISNLAVANDSLISAAATYTLASIGTVSSGGGANQFAGFFFAPTINYSTQQVVSIVPAFWARPTYVPTAATVDVLNFFTGFWSEPLFAPTVTGASTSLLAGYIATPRATVATGSATVANVDGFSAFPSASNQATVATGVTAALVSGVRIGNLLTGGGAGTVTAFSGVEIGALTSGTTTIGIHSGITSSAARYFMKSDGDAQSVHLGALALGSTTNPNVGAILDMGQNTAKTVILPKLTTATRDGLTAVDGMTLYNSDLDEVEMRASGAWEDASIGSDRSHVFWGHADAVTGVVNDGTPAAGVFATGGGTSACTTTTCSGTVGQAASGVGFMLSLPTGATSGNTCALTGGAGCTGASQTRYAFHPVVTFRIKTDSAITSTRIWCGLFDGDPSQTDNPTTRQVAAIRYSTGASDTTFKGVTCNGAACTVSAAISPAVATATEYVLRIDARSASQVKFTVNGTNLQTNSATLPSTSTNLGAHCVITTLTAAGRTLNWGLTHVRDQAY